MEYFSALESHQVLMHTAAWVASPGNHAEQRKPISRGYTPYGSIYTKFSTRPHYSDRNWVSRLPGSRGGGTCDDKGEHTRVLGGPVVELFCIVGVVTHISTCVKIQRTEYPKQSIGLLIKKNKLKKFHFKQKFKSWWALFFWPLNDTVGVSAAAWQALSWTLRGPSCVASCPPLHAGERMPPRPPATQRSRGSTLR